MILKEHIKHLERMRPYFSNKMLILGDHEFKTNFNFDVKYQTLDIHGSPNLKLDLTSDEVIDSLPKFPTVFNLGTLEHIWDVQKAYSNVVKLIDVGGYYLGHHPISGYENHGIHITNPNYIIRFFELNGFTQVDKWLSFQNGDSKAVYKRNCGQSIILWIVMKKERTVDTIVAPYDLCKLSRKENKK